MADTKRINVHKVKPSFTRTIVHQSIFWTILVGVIGLSKVWFGGSWVIDIVAAFLALLMMVLLTRRLVGSEVDLAKDQIAAWVAAGQPEDVKAWKERTYG